MTESLRRPPVILLDDSRSGRALLYTHAEAIITAATPAEVPAALDRLDTALERGLHVAGWIGYEAGLAFEARLGALGSALPPEPLIWLMAGPPPQQLDRSDLGALFEAAAAGTRRPAAFAGPDIRAFKPWYDAAFAEVMARIAAGDVYQINLTVSADVAVPGDPVALYARLRAAQPTTCSAFIDTGSWRVLSLSPELFVSVNAGRMTVRPMKGTAPRRPTAADDDAAAAALAADAKTRAENLMIVDLMRNDLSRLAVDGSVRTPALFDIERYPSVLQMTSTVTAERRPDVTAGALVRGIFPCGSVTGAPKIRAMETIAAVERGPRGVYTGAIGHFDPSGDLALNVAIRTLVTDSQGRGRFGIGSGLVADSDREAEWQECTLKGAFARADPAPLALIETMVWQRGTGIALLPRHLARLAASARRLGFRYDAASVRRAIADMVDGAAADVPACRVRLLLDAGGTVSVAADPLTPAPAGAGVVTLADQPQNRSNLYVYHKTTRRDHYEQPLARARARYPVDDVLFVNDAGRLTEAARHSLFIERNGTLVTPPVSDGLLPGVLRQALLERDDRPAVEASLTVEDLDTADAIYIGNSVRGLRRVRLM